MSATVWILLTIGQVRTHLFVELSAYVPFEQTVVHKPVRSSANNCGVVARHDFTHVLLFG